MSSLLTNTAICTTLLASVVDIIAAKNASEIPRFNTPYTGNLTNTFPLPKGTFGCGFPGNPPNEYLQECTEPINDNAPANMVGYWRNNETGLIMQRVEMCGDRFTLTSTAVVHDAPACTGVYNDGNGFYDYNGVLMLTNHSICSAISGGYCKFATNPIGEKCIDYYNYLTPERAAMFGVEPGEVKVAYRCVGKDGETMSFMNLQFQSIITYDKVPPEDEPNCMMCVGGDYDGVTSFSPDEVLPCPMSERQWRKCDAKSGSARIVGTFCMLFGGSLIMFLALL